MSNELLNWHIRQGSPFGENIGVLELADQIGCTLELNKINMKFDKDGDATEIIIGDLGIDL